MDRFGEIGYCGYYCGGCGNYQKNLNCHGCRSETELVSDCTTRVCAAELGHLHCGECGQFPCAQLQSFYSDGVPSHARAHENILRINEIGTDCWLKEQSAKGDFENSLI